MNCASVFTKVCLVLTNFSAHFAGVVTLCHCPKLSGIRLNCLSSNFTRELIVIGSVPVEALSPILFYHNPALLIDISNCFFRAL